MFQSRFKVIFLIHSQREQSTDLPYKGRSSPLSSNLVHCGVTVPVNLILDNVWYSSTHRKANMTTNLHPMVTETWNSSMSLKTDVRCML